MGRFFDQGDHWAVRGLSLDIAPGEFFGLLGPSGCGKTTTLNMIAGFLDPTEGSIHVTGRDLRSVPPHRRNVAMVFQDYALFPHLSARDNVAFGMKVRKKPRPVIDRRTTELLDFVDLAAAADRLPSQLSGGQQQRVAIARALAVDPGIVLLDEPLSNLDSRLRADVRLELKRLFRSAGVTVILVTHDQSEAFSLCDRVAVMFRGTAAAVGRPDDIYRLPPTVEVAEFVGEANLFPARVVTGGSTVLRAAVTVGADVVEREVVAAASVTSAGQEGHVLVRPEVARVTAESAGATAGLRGTIRDVSFLGEFASYQIDLGGRSVGSKVVYEGQLLKPGAPVTFDWAPKDAVFIPSETPAPGGTP
ncbi:MAG: ATP-binding cassette domain-containing protein [Micromonosporaceae bacterium]|nr:ATP-binding cassette domain-containing protein [Micromonosporaceae bacterium]